MNPTPTGPAALGAATTWQTDPDAPLADATRTARAAAWLLANAGRVPRTGATPHAVLHREHTATLRYFAPAEGTVATTPVFISMPLINTWTIFDLLPGRSVIEALVGHGVPVYLLDWGRPGPEDAHRGIADLVDGVLHRAMRRARRHAASQHEAEAMDAIGYCVGGTFLAVYLARHPEAVRRVAFVATPIDFHSSGRLAIWANPDTFPLDDLIDSLGNFPKELMQESFVWLRPGGVQDRVRALFDKFDRPGFPETWAAVEHWNGDGVDFCGEAYREYVRACYFDNALMDGSWVVGTDRVDLSAVTVPALVLSAAADHICPPAAAEGLAAVWGGPVRCETLRGGHVGIAIGRDLPAALLAWVSQ